MSGIINSAGSRSGIIGQTELDYEEGTFTASLTAATPPTSIPTAAGYYRLIGGVCHFNIRRFNAFSTAGASGAWRITGMPFGPVVACIINAWWTYNMSFTGSGAQCFEMDAASPILYAKEAQDGVAWTNWGIGTTGSTRYVSVSGSYIIN